MRDFLEYVQRSKEDAPNTVDFYMEGFSSDLQKIEGVNPEKTFILGFLIGEGIDIKENEDVINKLLFEGDSLPSEIINELKTNDEISFKNLKTSLNSALVNLKNVLKLKKEVA